MKFFYRKYPSASGFIEYPTVKIHLVNPKTKQVFPNYVVLIDSGAAACVFHAAIGEKVGVNITSGKKAALAGAVGAPGEQFLHEMLVIIGGHSIEIEVGFSYDLRIPFGLLGQKGFFEKFRVCFDLPKGNFEIVPKV